MSATVDCSPSSSTGLASPSDSLPTYSHISTSNWKHSWQQRSSHTQWEGTVHKRVTSCRTSPTSNSLPTQNPHQNPKNTLLPTHSHTPLPLQTTHQLDCHQTHPLLEDHTFSIVKSTTNYYHSRIHQLRHLHPKGEVPFADAATTADRHALHRPLEQTSPQLLTHEPHAGLAGLRALPAHRPPPSLRLRRWPPQEPLLPQLLPAAGGTPRRVRLLWD